MKLELLQLRYFYEAASQESITKTANSFLVPPSSVSIAIKRLENELGCELFARSGNRIRLNQNGRTLHQALGIALKQLDDAVEQLTQAHAELSGEVSLLVRCSRRILLERMQRFRQMYPGVMFHLVHDFATVNLDQFDIVVDAASPVYHSRFVGEPMFQEQIRIAAAEHHPLCRKQLVIRDLQNEPFLTMCKGSSLRQQMLDACQKAGFSPNIVIESDDPLYLRNDIELGFGIHLSRRFPGRDRWEIPAIWKFWICRKSALPMRIETGFGNCPRQRRHFMKC